MAKADKEKTTEAEPAASQNSAASAPSTGVRAQRAIMMKQFVPNPDWINKNIVGPGKGTKLMVGRIVGFVTGHSEKEGQLPNGDKSISIVLHGMFESENYLDGEIASASTVYFPMAFAEAVRAAFVQDADLKTVEIDTDIGLEATGKTIPYTWVVVNHIEGEAQNVLKRRRLARPRPAGAVALLPGKTAPAQLTEQK